MYKEGQGIFEPARPTMPVALRSRRLARDSKSPQGLTKPSVSPKPEEVPDDATTSSEEEEGSGDPVLQAAQGGSVASEERTPSGQSDEDQVSSELENDSCEGGDGSYYSVDNDGSDCDSDNERQVRSDKEADSSELEGDSDEETGAMDSEDSDSSPEDVAFTDSKQKVKSQARSTLTQISKSKEIVKEKRKRREDLYASQKRQRLEKLASSRRSLPESEMGNLPITTASREVAEEVKGLEDPGRMPRTEDVAAVKKYPECGYEVVTQTEIKAPLRSAALDFKKKFQLGARVVRESARMQAAKVEKRKCRGKV